MSIGGSLPADANGLRYVGPGGLLPAGTQVGATDYAQAHVRLYDVNGMGLVFDNGRIVVAPKAATTLTAVNGGGSITSDQLAAVAAAANLRFLGYSVMEDVGASASFRIMHGATVGGGVQAEVVSLTAGESTADSWPSDDAIAIPNGLSIDWISGSFKLSLKTKVVS
jgi:hypothetical protein